jgi:hypothetical protein
MERQKPTTSVQHNDEFSRALIESYGRWTNGAGFGWHLHEEGIPAEQKQGEEQPTREGGADASTSIPDLAGSEEKSDEGEKDIKANAGAPDPATNLRVGAGVKQSHGAEIRDTTKVVAKESCDTCSNCGGKGCSKCQTESKNSVKKEAVSFELDGATYIFEVKMDGKDDNGNSSCWKGYKKQGTKAKGGKEVNNCVKEGKKLDPVGKEDKDIDNDGDHDKSDKYLLARRKKISKVIGTKKKMKEETEKK